MFVFHVPVLGQHMCKKIRSKFKKIKKFETHTPVSTKWYTKPQLNFFCHFQQPDTKRTHHSGYEVLGTVSDVYPDTKCDKISLSTSIYCRIICVLRLLVEILPFY